MHCHSCKQGIPIISRIFTLFCLLLGINGTILRLPCSTIADFSIQHSGKRLKSHVIRIDYGINDVQCMVKCIELRSCRSYNVNIKDMICELNSKAHVDEGTSLASNRNWMYKSTNFDSKLLGPTCKQLKPCKEGSFCRDTCTPPYYECLLCNRDSTGVRCSGGNDQSLCLKNPCKNSGKCIDLSSTYKCECAPGYYGRHCEIDVDECFSLPCLNGGVCLQGIGKYDCHCPPGYTGVICDIDIDECASTPCNNGGTCFDHLNKYTCSCQPGYSGKNCQTNIDECESGPCRNGATCNDQINRYTCSCQPGFSGTHCQTDINECASNPCQHGGTCFDHLNKYTCSCQPGYSGENCQTNIDECASGPCRNGATCNDQVNRYTCSCQPGFSGTHCQTNINECASNPCQHGATCVDHANSYTCTCRAPFSGTNCDVATCMDLKNAGFLSGIYNLRFPGGVHEVYCDAEINGGGYTFFSSATLPKITQADLGMVFSNHGDVLLRLLKPDGGQSYTVVKQYIDTGGLSVQLSQYHGYRRPENSDIAAYLYLGLLPVAQSKKGDLQGLKSNNIDVTFRNCDGNSNNYFAFFAKPNDKTPNYNGHYENQGVAVNWRGTAILHHSKLPREYFLFTTIGFGGCGCYTESSAWSQATHPALGTAIGVR